MAQVVEHQPDKHEILNRNPSTAKRNKQKTKIIGTRGKEKPPKNY
jgi:hypothetical protein